MLHLFVLGISIIKEFRLIQSIEQDYIDRVNEEIKKHPKKEDVKKSRLNGSLRQGSFSSSLFSPHCREKGEHICRDLDADAEITYEEELKEPSCLKDVKEKLGRCEPCCF